MCEQPHATMTTMDRDVANSYLRECARIGDMTGISGVLNKGAHRPERPRAPARCPLPG